MIHLHDLKPSDIGRWVVYRSYGSEVGRLKGWNNLFLFVDFSCDRQWNDYTGQPVNPEDCEFKE